MPLTEKGSTIKNAMIREYGGKKGEQVFYASKNAGKIEGVDAAYEPPHCATMQDQSMIPKSFRGDQSHLAGPGKGILSVAEYKPK